MVQRRLLICLLGVISFGAEHKQTLSGSKPVTPCRATVTDMIRNHPMLMTPFTMASGKSLPYDAGRWVTCNNYNNTRYFLVQMQGHVPGVDVAIPVKLGFCLPNVCDHDGVKDLVNSTAIRAFVPMLYLELPSFNGTTVSAVSSTSPNLDMKDPDAGCAVAWVITGFLIFLIFVSTAITLMAEPRPSRAGSAGSAGTPALDRQRSAGDLGTQGQQLLQVQSPEVTAEERREGSGALKKYASMTLIKAFSLFGKTGTLTKLREKTPYKPTDSLNGLRVISMAWIIMGHTFLMPTGISGYANMEDISNNPLNKDVAETNPLFQLVLGAQSGVDTFFFLSGFLLAHLTIKEIRAGKLKGCYKYTMAIILRYIRLTPSLAIIMMIYYKIWIYFADGPFAVDFQKSINERCDGSWWSELTYTMNFIPFDSNKVCMGWSWYLGDDMIFFIITLFILPVYAARKMAGWLIVLLITFISFGVTIALVTSHDLSVYVFDHHYADYSYWAYSKPYTRIPAYFVGVIAAWVLDELESRGYTRETRPTTGSARTLANLTAVVTLIVILFIVLIPASDFGANKNSWSNTVNVLYITFSRPCFAACWAIITLLCYYDYIPLINGFLAHPGWTPFARLTYGAYLVHPLVIKLAAARSVQFYSFNSMDILYRFVGNCVCATLGSCGLWALCERPCMTIFSPARGARAARTPEATPEKPAAPTVNPIPAGNSV